MVKEASTEYPLRRLRRGVRLNHSKSLSLKSGYEDRVQIKILRSKYESVAAESPDTSPDAAPPLEPNGGLDSALTSVVSADVQGKYNMQMHLRPPIAAVFLFSRSEESRSHDRTGLTLQHAANLACM